MKQKILNQLNESLHSVLPIILIVLVLCFCIAPVPSGMLLCFLVGSVFLVIGMMLFTLGAETAMTPIGEKLGSGMARTKKLSVIILAGFATGFVVTVAEPDLQVLAAQVPSVSSRLLILSVAAGVGIFLVIALLRMLFSIPLNILLIVFYSILILIAFFVPDSFLGLSFDSGGVTTGPMTVPFIMALGVGISSIRSDHHAADDSFGLVALCSIGPVLMVMLIGIFSPSEAGTSAAAEIPDVADSLELSFYYLKGLPEYLREMLLSLAPVLLLFGLFQLTPLRVRKGALGSILCGLVYTYTGLVLFMTGVNLGFMPMGRYLGEVLTGMGMPWFVIGAAMVMGYFCVKAEPAVYVLNAQVEEITDGAISAKLMGHSLSIGVSVSLGLSMIRVFTGISIFWFVIPGYVLALVISFFVPKIYTAIAFDSGGVASGPMTAAFLLPFAQGVCIAYGGDPAKDAFGVVAMVALTPLITLQVLGLLSSRRAPGKSAPLLPEAGVLPADDSCIIEL